MPESQSHIDLVKLLVVEAHKIVPYNEVSFIYVDNPTNKDKPPRTLKNFTPDLYFNFRNVLIIGEAKTGDDVLREHSIEQYESYYEEAIKYNGKAILIFAVPWYVKNTIKNTIKRISKKYPKKIDCFVVTETGVSEKI